MSSSDRTYIVPAAGNNEWVLFCGMNGTRALDSTTTKCTWLSKTGFELVDLFLFSILKTTSIGFTNMIYAALGICASRWIRIHSKLSDMRLELGHWKLWAGVLTTERILNTWGSLICFVWASRSKEKTSKEN